MRLFILMSLFWLNVGGNAIAARTLTEKDFKTKIVGHTFNWKQSTSSGTVRFAPSGKISITFNNNKKLKKDSGKWQWKSGANCTRYKKIRKGKEKCTKLYFDDPGFRGANGSVLRYKN
ncbi:MAG TPA: hypothetical protein DCS30_02390 [Rhizobiales bacterium]|nr:hypothetical protein [Hyphomicrobiales bacterium]